MAAADSNSYKLTKRFNGIRIEIENRFDTKLAEQTRTFLNVRVSMLMQRNQSKGCYPI